LREALHALICDIENGLSLSDAMARRPREFPRLYVAMVKAGELGGVLDEVLERVANVMEGERAARKRLWAALTYPLVVSGAAAGLILFLLTTIVPMFRAMYAQLHVPLPAVTSALIAAGVALQSPLTWTCLAAAAATAVFAVLRIRAAQRGAMLLESLVLALPVAGPIMKKTSIGRFARMLGTLLRSGVALVWALDIVTDVVTGPRFRQSIADLRQALREGALVSSSLERSGLYEPMFIQLVHVGEETGSLDAMLLRIAEYYELDVETMLAALGSMLEPLMILVLGGAVGFIVAAVFIPLYTLIGNIK
jgi:type IV pilus assembly protein PilC